MKLGLTILGAGAAVLALTTLARAAEPVVYVPPVVPPAPAPVGPYDWSGFSVGVNAGYAFGEAESLPFGALTGVGDTDVDGPFLGVQAGFNFGSNFIIGIEADWATAGIDGTYLGPPGPDSIFHEIDSIATVRGKLGFPVGSNGQVLPYVTGGWGWINTTRTSDAQVVSNNHDGWNAGIGVDVGVTENISVGLLYLYQDYSEEVYDFPVGNDPLVDAILHSLSLRVDFRF